MQNIVNLLTREAMIISTRPPTLEPHTAEGLEYSLMINTIEVRTVYGTQWAVSICNPTLKPVALWYDGFPVKLKLSNVELG